MKKIGRIITFTLISFLFAGASIKAKTMTFDELGALLESPKWDSNYAYIIGEHVFTTRHILTTTDIMLGATTIETENKPTVKDMVIARMDYNAKTKKWDLVDVVGKNKINKNAMRVLYIDHEIQPEETKVATQLNIEDSKYTTYKNVLSTSLNFKAEENYDKGSISEQNGILTGLILKNENISLSPEDKLKYGNPTYFFAYILEVPEANINTTIKLERPGKEEKEIGFDKFDVTKNGTPGIVILVPINEQDTQLSNDQKVINITVDVDGTEEEYQAKNIKIDWSGLEFQKDSNNVTADNNTGSIVNADQFAKPSEPLTITNQHNQILLGGNVVEQHLLNTQDMEATNYYAPVHFNLPKGATITIPCSGESEQCKDSKKVVTVTEENGVSILFPLKDDKTSIEIIIDLDGNQNHYFETKYTIDYSGVTFKKSSPISAQESDETTESKLTTYGWDEIEGYETNFEETVLNDLEKNVKVTGFMPINTTLNHAAFDAGLEETGYYFAYQIHLGDGKEFDESKSVINFLKEEPQGISLFSVNELKLVKVGFDSTDKDSLYILMSLNKNESNNFKIEIDLDGDGTDYEKYVIHVDLSELKYQERSKAEFTLDLGQTYKDAIMEQFEFAGNRTESGFTSLSLNETTLNGAIFEEKTKYNGKDEADDIGYYVAMQLNLKNDNGDSIDATNAQITVNGKLVLDSSAAILVKLDKDCASSSCTFTVKVDADGSENNNYLETEYTIKYSDVTFVKSSLFEVNKVETPDILETTYGWTLKDGYNTDFEENADDVNKTDVTGLIPIFKKEEFTNQKPFGDIDYKYYLGFIIHKDEDLTNATINGSSNFVTQKSGNNDIYVLAYLDENHKQFEVTLDIDGSGENYAPYTLTIDCTSLDLQQESLNASLNAITESSQSTEQATLGNWGFDFNKITENVIKQQTLNDQYLEEEKEGYYLPIKIAFPTVTHQSNYSITFDTSIGKKISDGSYQNGVEVLLKLDRDSVDKKITFTIDFDGTGNYYLPVEYTFDYSAYTFLSENIVTFKDGDGNNFGEVQTLYENDKVTKPQTNPTKDYHDFKYWSVDGSSEYSFDTSLTKDQDLTLIPHWTLLYDTYIKDQIDSINESNKENFVITKEDKNIKVKVMKPEMTFESLQVAKIIDEVIEKGEVKEITLTIGGVSKAFTSDTTAASAMNDFITEQLGGSKTLDEFESALQDKEFKISISKVVDTVDSISDAYTFTFTADFAIVTSEDTFKTALANPNVTNILIKNQIDLAKTLEISVERPIVIKSLDGTQTIKDTQETTEGDTDVRPVIRVIKGNVTFENLILEGATRGISVGTTDDSSGLNKDAIVTAHNVTAKGSQDAGFDVAKNATFTGTDLQYLNEDNSPKESYHYPTICGLGTVNVEDYAKVENYQRIVRVDGSKWTEKDLRDPETGNYLDGFFENGKLTDEANDLLNSNHINHHDQLFNTGHTHYYQNKDNSVYYKFIFRDSRINLIIFKYFAKGDEITPPVDNTYKISEKATDFHYFIKAYIDKDNKTWVHDGWTTSSDGRGNKVTPTLPSASCSTDNCPVAVYYSRFVEGYRVTIPMDVAIDEKPAERTGVFGIPKSDSELKISDLMNRDDDFKNAFNALKAKAEGLGNGSAIIDSTGDKSVVVTENTVITQNMKLEIAIPLKSSSMDIQINASSKIITQDLNSSKFNLPVTLQSDDFQPNTTVVTVIDPNGDSSSTHTVTEANTLNLNLEAIKKSKITSGNKMYTLKVDIDGADKEEYAVKTYTIDYNDYITEEELLNNAAQRTQDATNLTVTRDNRIKNNDEKFTYEYDRNKVLTHYVSTDSLIETYTFQRKYADENHVGDGSIYVKKDASYECVKGSSDCKPKINDWVLENMIQKVSLGVHELSLLQDMIQDKSTVNAIEKVTKVDDHYEVTLNMENFTNWLNNAYITTENKDNQNIVPVSNEVKLIVKLTSDNQYIESITTSGDFSIQDKANNVTTNDNHLNVTISKIENTTILEPLQFLAKDGTNVTQTELKDFDTECEKYYEAHIGGEVA